MRRDPEELSDDGPREYRDKGGRRALVPHQPEHKRRDCQAKPDLRLDQPNAESGERKPEPELQPSRDSARQDAGDPADDAGQAEDQEERADDDAGAGDG